MLSTGPPRLQYPNIPLFRGPREFNRYRNPAQGQGPNQELAFYSNFLRWPMKMGYRFSHTWTGLDEKASVRIRPLTRDPRVFRLSPRFILQQETKIYFAAVGTAYSATISFNTVGEEHYREAIDLMLAGVDPVLAPGHAEDRDVGILLENWPAKFKDEARRYWPKGQRLLTAIYWPAIMSGFQRELAPAGALLITKREFVFISEEKRSPRQLKDAVYEFGGIITFFPRVRLTDFHVSHHDRFGILALQVHSTHGGEKLGILFASDEERTLSNVIESVLAEREPTTTS